MNLSYETILDIYVHKNKKIFVQIKVIPSKSKKNKNTCRGLTQEQWDKFDEKLEKLITTIDNWNDEKCPKFNISSSIEVKVQKSKISFKNFHIWMGAISKGIDMYDLSDDMVEANYVLECQFDFQDNQSSPNLSMESQEYEPQVEASLEGKLTLTYQPYMPSKKEFQPAKVNTFKNPDLELIDDNDDTYSPKPLFEVHEANLLISEKIPKYTPAPIKETNRNSKKVAVEKKYSLELAPAFKRAESKSNNKLEIEYIPKSQKNVFADIPVYIPTPIGEISRQQKVLETDNNFRKHRKRSKTIDEFPLTYYENTMEKHKTIEKKMENTTNFSYLDNRILKKRSMTIDEMSAIFAINEEKVKLKEDTQNNNCKKLQYPDKTITQPSKTKVNSSKENISTTKEKALHNDVPVYIPTSIDEITKQEIAYKKEHRKRFKTIGDCLLTLEENCNSKHNEFAVNNEAITNNDASYSSTTASTLDTCEQNIMDIERRMIKNKTTKDTALRRSIRLPSKPNRLIEEQPNLLKGNKSEKSKTSPTNKELFGTDDEDDEKCLKNKVNTAEIKSPIFETASKEKTRKSTSSMSSAKKKQKRNKYSEREHVKLNMTE